MDNDTLRAQFNLLQDQQRKKLQRKNELKEAACVKASIKPMDEKTFFNNSIHDSLWASEDIERLELKLCDDPKEENDNYTDKLESENQLVKIRELTDENGRLYKLLKEREEELKIVKRRWKEERKELTGQSIASDGAAKKIIELSKRNRELTMEAEKEKTKSSQLERKLESLEIHIQSYQNDSTAREKKEDCFNKEETQDTMDTKSLQEKLVQSLNKVSEFRVQVDNLKEELKVAHRVIAKEVGDGVSIQSLLGGSGNWKGRQQQIIQLQNKVAELQAKVSNLQQMPSVSSPSASALSFSSSSTTIHDDKYRTFLKKIELDRKEVIEKQQSDLENLEKEMKKLKEKLDAAKVRNNVLSTELKSVKAQLTTMKDKGKHDDELISVLLSEQSKLKEQNSKLKKKDEEPPGNKIYQPKQDEKLVFKLQEQVKTQERKVTELEAEIQVLQKNSSRHSGKVRTNSSTSRTSTQQQHTGKKKSDNVVNASDENRYEHFESEIHEYKRKLQESKTLQQVAEVERDRLIELVQVLERRIDETKGSNLKTKEELIESKRKGAKLEKQVERLQNCNTKPLPGFVGNVRPRGAQKGQVNTQADSKKTHNDFVAEIEELETRLGIQMDTSDAIKGALDSTLKAKEADLKFYQDMLEQTKKIFLSGLKEFKQNVTY